MKWNFEKFLVTPAGEVHRFRPKVEPDAAEIVDLIEASLTASGDRIVVGPTGRGLAAQAERAGSPER